MFRRRKKEELSNALETLREFENAVIRGDIKEKEKLKGFVRYYVQLMSHYTGHHKKVDKIIEVLEQKMHLPWDMSVKYAKLVNHLIGEIQGEKDKKRSV